MAVAAPGHAPICSRIWRLPQDSASERGSLPACSSVLASISAMRAAGMPRLTSSAASAMPAGPAPHMATS
jgi:hypothetical protein